MAKMALFAVLLVLSFAHLSLKAFGEEVHVRIKNELSDDMKIKVHCQVGDQSLGTQTIVKGMAIEWRIDDTTDHKTSPSYCDIEWNELDGYHFEVYDRKRCHSKCSWHVTEQGPLLRNQNSGSWEPMPYNPLPGKKETEKEREKDKDKEEIDRMVFGVSHVPIHVPPHKCICWPPKQ